MLCNIIIKSKGVKKMPEKNEDKVLEKNLPIQIRIEAGNPRNCSGDCRFIFPCNSDGKFIVLCGLYLKELPCDTTSESFENVKRCPQCIVVFGVQQKTLPV
jgi:hypothetical protein